MSASNKTLKSDPCTCPMCTVYHFLLEKGDKKVLAAYEKIIERAEVDATDIWALRRKASTENAFWFEGKFWRQVHN